METSWVNYYSGLLLVISYNLLLKSFYTAEQSFWLYLQLSYRSSVKYKKKSEIISAVLQWFQICIILTPWRLMHIIFVIAHLPTSLSIWHDVLILHSNCFLLYSSWMLSNYFTKVVVSKTLLTNTEEILILICLILVLQCGWGISSIA